MVSRHGIKGSPENTPHMSSRIVVFATMDHGLTFVASLDFFVTILFLDSEKEKWLAN